MKYMNISLIDHAVEKYFSGKTSLNPDHFPQLGAETMDRFSFSGPLAQVGSLADAQAASMIPGAKQS
ncbi:hypothetical protein [Microvirga sp. TS319]|uniref:hypothetical protein n=1 Tax=Microvirga sp. TS319 TaxID=3241165 RepID=UPI00351A7CFC